MAITRLLWLLPFLFFLPVCLNSQIEWALPPVTKSYQPLEVDELNAYREKYGNNKTIPNKIESQVLVALSHYPELRDVDIDFVMKKHNTAHTSAPKVLSLFKKKKKRKYKITISTDIKPLLAPGMHDRLSFNARVGVIGHELGHTAYYHERNSLQVIAFGFKYLFKKFRQKVENETDRIAIRHNLGYQLLKWSIEAHPVLEAAGRGDNYLKPEDILEEIEN